MSNLGLPCGPEGVEEVKISSCNRTPRRPGERKRERARGEKQRK